MTPGDPDGTQNRREKALIPKGSSLCAFCEFLVQQLIPYLGKSFPTTSDGRQRNILGLSLGGMHAAHMDLNYPQVFGPIVMQSPAFHDLEVPLRLQSTHEHLRLQSTHGTSAFPHGPLSTLAYTNSGMSMTQLYPPPKYANGDYIHKYPQRCSRVSIGRSINAGSKARELRRDVGPVPMRLNPRPPSSQLWSKEPRTTPSEGRQRREWEAPCEGEARIFRLRPA